MPSGAGVVQAGFSDHGQHWVSQKDRGQEKNMKIRRTAVVTGAVVAVIGAGATAAVSASGEDGETGSTNVTSQEKQDATDAALEATGGGTANSVERDSENGATFEVEVTKPNGDTVDVRLDEGYDVVVIEGDSDSGSDD
jgi:uncharacterized membrane protein YkoI